MLTRRLLESDWYRRGWGQRVALVEDHNQKASYETTAGGGRMATAVGGGATGEGGDLILIDDPHKLEEAFSQATRGATLDWFDGTISTRLNNPRTSAIIVIAQRVHQADLSGHLLDSGEWTHLCLPAQYEPRHPYIWPKDPRTTQGQPLWPDHVGAPEIERQKRQLGSLRDAGQLQQLPAPAEGAIFNRDWFRWYDPSDRLPRFEEILISCDLAFTGTPTSDYVVIQGWGKAEPNIYLLAQTREHLSFTQTETAIRAIVTQLHDRFPHQHQPTVLIEQSANGPAVTEILRQQLPNVLPYKPRGDKIARAYAISPTVEAGNVYLPGDPRKHQGQPWVEAFLHEITTFPSSAYDDQVDAMTEALDRLTRPGPRLRVLALVPVLDLAETMIATASAPHTEAAVPSQLRRLALSVELRRRRRAPRRPCSGESGRHRYQAIARSFLGADVAGVSGCMESSSAS
jgi:predicted phage terminase large subunit-like protein